jgi:hypothetical protein
VTEPGGLARPVVPALLLAGFADGSGRLMAERRDRTRRRLVALEAAVAELGSYQLLASPADALALARLLDEAEAAAAQALVRMLGGAFPPGGADRASLALVLAVQLLLGRRHRAEAARAATLVGGWVAAAIEEVEAAHRGEAEEGETEGEEPVSASETAGVAPPVHEPPATAEVPAPPGPAAISAEAGAESVLIAGEPPVRRSLAAVPLLARQLAWRTWQLVRFPAPVLLTSDTPAVLWVPPSVAKPHQVGLAAADEVRVPLDPRHALIIARRAQAGEIVRDLGERQARALNRTVAEAAAEWMYSHPESDPLEGVELPPIEVA